MKREELEKYMGELSPEMQEKARACKDMNELNALLAENDVELSEDAIGAVAGGCSQSNAHPVGTLMEYNCPFCKGQLKYWDSVFEGWICERMYCDNLSCKKFNNGLLYVNLWESQPRTVKEYNS